MITDFDKRLKVTSKILSLIKFNQTIRLNSETKVFLSKRMKQAKFYKKEIIKNESDPCKSIYVIKKGLVRGFYTFNESEITSWISTDNEIFTSITCFFSQSLSKEKIEALEDTYVDYLDFIDFQEAINRFSDFNTMYSKMLEEYYAFAENRAIISRIPNARERLVHFLKHYDHAIIKRAPKKILASFLNMRPETLSRLIKETNNIHI